MGGLSSAEIVLFLATVSLAALVGDTARLPVGGLLGGGAVGLGDDVWGVGGFGAGAAGSGAGEGVGGGGEGCLAGTGSGGACGGGGVCKEG
jgi:hypothetical protein